MIKISNLRKISGGGLTRLEADIDFIGMESPYSERTLYFEIADENADMLIDDSYDAFVLIPFYLAMYHKQDLHICGNISKKLYKNLTWYVYKILCDFSKDLTPINLTVDGFTSTKPKGTLIGTGISCGVDSFSTIYDHFVKDNDPNYRINALFMFNYGSCGDFGDPRTIRTFQNRYRRNSEAAKELGLPVYPVDTNMHAFTHARGMGGQKLGFFALYSCIFSLQNTIFKYYTSSALSYENVKIFGAHYYNHDMAGFSESYIVPLIQTERLELIIDGCQYRRVDKVKKIANWDIARKYLNVCTTRTNDAHNCGKCGKCLRTLLPLEILGKLDNFSGVFDIEKYKTISDKYKLRCLKNYGKEPFETENVDFAKENNFPMPTLNKTAAAVKKK